MGFGPGAEGRGLETLGKRGLGLIGVYKGL